MTSQPLRAHSSVSLDLTGRGPSLLEKSRRSQTEPVQPKDGSVPTREYTSPPGFTPFNRSQRVLTQPVILRRAETRLHTPWFSSPISHHHRGHTENPSTEGHPTDEAPLAGRGDEGDGSLLWTRQGSSTIELLYDLFFTANLSQFTSNHDIDTKEALGSYMGFVCLLWFTWLQTSLFDVRFFADSVVSRVYRCISFGVMIGFAIVGPRYDTNDVANETKVFRTMSIILMISRLVLATQYIIVLWHLRRLPKAILPLVSTVAVLGISAMVFLGLTFSFEPGVNRYSYFGWYMTMLAEALGVIVISSFWRVVSFRETHLVERIGLLTLIMMGQGVSGIASSVASLLQNSYEPSASDAGVIGGAVIVIIFIWILYFDQVEHDRFGAIKQQMWTLLHFPFHLALLLTMEGNAQFIIWNAAVNNINWTSSKLQPFVDSVTPGQLSTFSTSAEYVTLLNRTLATINARFTDNLTDLSVNLTTIANSDLNSLEGRTQILEVMDDVVIRVWTFVLANFGITDYSAPDEPGATNALSNYDFTTLLSAFSTVLVLFFVGAGSFLFMLGVMYWFGKEKITGSELYSVAVRLVSGLALALSMLVYFDRKAFYGLLQSSWVLPIVVLVFAAVIISDNVLTWYYHTRAGRRKTLEFTEPKQEA